MELRNLVLGLATEYNKMGAQFDIFAMIGASDKELMVFAAELEEWGNDTDV